MVGGLGLEVGGGLGGVALHSLRPRGYKRPAHRRGLRHTAAPVDGPGMCRARRGPAAANWRTAGAFVASPAPPPPPPGADTLCYATPQNRDPPPNADCTS